MTKKDKQLAREFMWDLVRWTGFIVVWATVVWLACSVE